MKGNFIASLVVASCLAIPGIALANTPPIRITYVSSWQSSNIETHIVGKLIQEKMHLPVRLISTEAGPMWASVAKGSADLTVTAWLPYTQKQYWQRFQHQVVNLGPITTGTWAGLAVPSYVPVHSLSQLEHYHHNFNGRIIGIGDGAGVMITTREAIKAYGMHHMHLLASSTPAMEAQVARSVARKKWVVFTCWKPLGIWAKFHLRPLADPKNIYGKPGNIDAVINPELKHTHPALVKFLGKVNIPLPEVQAMMVEKQDGKPMTEIVQKWITSHQAEVASWLKA
ncbi:glycine/betaine ABC transporter substrate-binding protein [Acidithiobacillus marinus]|uniref:Glycine/betaine ABC transporter substrate-binding protein n=1 Tax=Acidithiobacillus marinus TaxID=187490 RepID=A0A2I1DNP3_9PROT|nr:glycine betaine ABC transporter substrate-binding protein [Acidithiobacillus marinus]PKY11500.1 glycine/betaine ABC transporter substrate-binding protein [Acidithiobacillus marinus]